jgi:hypothetical protein
MESGQKETPLLIRHCSEAYHGSIGASEPCPGLVFRTVKRVGGGEGGEEKRERGEGGMGGRGHLSFVSSLAMAIDFATCPLP